MCIRDRSLMSTLIYSILESQDVKQLSKQLSRRKAICLNLHCKKFHSISLHCHTLYDPCTCERKKQPFRKNERTRLRVGHRKSTNSYKPIFIPSSFNICVRIRLLQIISHVELYYNIIRFVQNSTFNLIDKL